MNYCSKCEWEYEEGECLCPAYRKFMEEGFTNAVPMAWKVDWWDGYPNNPGYCDHRDLPEFEGHSVKCKLCGMRFDPPLGV